MYDGLVRQYRYNKEHSIKCDDFPDRKCAFISMEELKTYYGKNGFNIEPNKYTTPAMAKHVHIWEYLGLAKVCDHNGVNGVIITLA